MAKNVKPNGNWRCSPKYFTQTSSRRTFGRGNLSSLGKSLAESFGDPSGNTAGDTGSLVVGAVNMSPAWFQQGHEVFSALTRSSNVLIIQDGATPLEASANLKKNTSPDCRRWLEEMSETSALFSAMLRIMHPDQYAAGREAVEELFTSPEKLADPEDTISLLPLWSSVFNGVSIISNRESPPHRDSKTRFEWFDILTTNGNYSDGWLNLPGLQLKLAYNPGTVVAFSGKLLLHEVKAVEGDRVCLAYYMRDCIHKFLGVGPAGWRKWDDIKKEYAM